MYTTMIPRIILLTLPVFAAVVPGCTNDPFGPLADTILGKKTPASTTLPGAHTKAAAPSTQDVCKDVNFVSSLDVDTAYGRVMRTFRFKTWEDEKKLQASGTHWTSDGFRHNARPGAFYEMADLVGFNDGQGSRRVVWMEIQLSREGSAQTHTAAKYCVNGKDPKVGDAQFYPYAENLIRGTMK